MALTADGGRHWQVRSTRLVLPAEVDFVNSTDGFVLGVRGGRAPAPGVPGATVPCGSGSGALGACSTMLATTDGGVTWHTLAVGRGPISSMVFVSPRMGLVATAVCKAEERSCAGELLRTTDGGGRWALVLKTPRPVLALAGRGREAWAVEATTSAGHRPAVRLMVLRSVDHGSTWSVLGEITEPGLVGPSVNGLRVQLELGSDLIGAASVYDPSTCAMHGCGIDSLLSTDDGGLRWRQTNLPGGELGCDLSPQVFTVAATGELLVEARIAGQCPAIPDAVDASFNGGRSWRQLASIGVAPTVESVSSPGGRVAWAAAGAAILRSNDGGVSWTQVFPEPEPQGGIDFVSGRLGYGFSTAADPGSWLATTDGGRRWRQVSELHGQFLAAGFSSPEDGFALVTMRPPAGGLVKVVSTTNGGRHWAPTAPIPISVARTLSSVVASAFPLSISAASKRSVAFVAGPPVVPSEGAVPASRLGARLPAASRSARTSTAPAPMPPVLVWSSDGGRRWRTRALPSWAAGIAASSLLGPRHLLVVGSCPVCPLTLGMTGTGGERWLSLGDVPAAPPSSPGQPGYGLDVVTSKRWWLWLVRFGDAYGQPGRIVRETGLLYTGDAGRRWTRYLVPVTDLVSPRPRSGWPVEMGPVSVDFLDGRGRSAPDGWLLASCEGAPGNYTGGCDTLWHTDDGGRDWKAMAVANSR